MKNILLAMLLTKLFSIFANGQDAQFVPQTTQEIFKLEKTLELKNDKIISYALLDDDRKLLIVGKKTIQVFDIESSKTISEIPHEMAKFHDFHYGTKMSPDGNHLLVFDWVSSQNFPILVKSKKRAAVIYDLRTGKLNAVLEGGLNTIWDVFWSENGKTLVTTTEWDNRTQEHEICFLDGETLKYRNCVSVFGTISWLKLSKDGTKFFAYISKEIRNLGVYLGVQNWVGIWDTEKVKLSKKFKLGEKRCYKSDLFISQNEKFLGVGESIFEIDGNDLPKFESEKRIRSSSEDSKYFIVNEKKGLQFFDFENMQRKYLIPKIKDDININISKTEKVVINQNLLSHCGRTEGFEIETGKKLWEIKLACRYEPSDTFFPSGKPDFNDSIDFLHDGKYFLTSSEKAIRVWDTMTGELVQALINPVQAIEKAKNSNADDKIKGETKVWSKDKKFIYFQDDDDTKIFQYELLNP